MKTNALLGRLITAEERWRRNALLRDRPLQSVEELYTQYFQDHAISRQAFAEVWRRIARVLHVKAGLILPTDTLADLSCLPKAIDKSSSTDIGRLMAQVQARLNAEQSMPMSEFVKTLRDVAIVLSE